MTTQAISDDLRFKGFLLNLADKKISSGDGKWMLPTRVLFCVASAILSWMIFVRLAETLIG